MTPSPLLLYRGEILGGYGYVDKPWFPPHVRLQAFLAAIEARDYGPRVRFIDAPPAADDDLLRVHPRAYVEWVRRRCAEESGALDHGPTFARRSVEAAATHVVGAVVDAIDRILAGEASRAFVPIAGFHHARASEARSYCLYNDPAIAIRTILERGIERVAYVDTDVHHGDGVDAIFAEEPRVWIVDLHEDGRTLWPHSPENPGEGPFPGDREAIGEGPARGRRLNLPLKAGAGDREFAAAWAEARDLVDAAKPGFIVYEAGVDALAGDPMGHLQLSIESLVEVTAELRALADRHADGRMLVLGGGGYQIDNVVAGWPAIVEALL